MLRCYRCYKNLARARVKTYKMCHIIFVFYIMFGI